MENRQPKIKIDFIRHGAYDSSDLNIKESECPLTVEGREEVKKIKERVSVEKDQTVSFSGNNFRSLASTISVADLADPSFVGIENIEEAINTKKIVQDSELLYRFLGNFAQFKESVGIPKEQKKLFRAVVQFSDKYKQETGSQMTAYKDMREKVAKMVLRYIVAFQNWEKISHKYKNETMFRLVCANEYFYASFRYRITEIVFGEEEAKKYLDWYESEYERNEGLKISEQSFSIIRKGVDIEIVLKDVYGEVVFNDNKLLQV